MDFTCEKEYDILVAGGGVAGVAAAVEAARSGKRVVLIEKSTQLGGLATIGLVNFFVPMCNGRGVQIVKGMSEEFLQLSKKYGYDTIPSDWQNGEPGYNKTTQRYVCKYSAPIFSLVLCELLDSLNVDIMFDSIITDVNITDGTVDGAAVSQAIDEDGSICTINIKKLQERLESENVIIHFDDSLIPKETKIEKVDIGHF